MNLLVWRALNTSKYFTGGLNLNFCIFHYEGWEGINSYLCLWKFLPLNTMIPWGFSWLVFQEVNWSSRSRYIGWECKPENLKRIFWIICLTFYKDKNWLAYCWYFAKYLLIYFPWSRVVDNPHHSSILQDALIRRPSHHSLLCLFCFFCWGRGWIYLDFSEGDLEKAAFSLLI